LTVGRRKGEADGPLDQREDEQSQADDADECFDPPVVLQEHGGDRSRPLRCRKADDNRTA
jgi:hypothetical protein